MGSLDLRRPRPELDATLWSQFPVVPDRAQTRSLLRELAVHIADVSSVPPPGVFDDAARSPSFARVVAEFPVEVCDADLLGVAYEQLMASPERRARGAHFTPIDVADAVVGCAVGQLDLVSCGSEISVWDPSAGGGAFLLAAARRIERDTSLTRALIVRHLYASDIDSLSLDVCIAAVELWCGCTASPVTHVGDALLDLPDEWPSDFDLIVGNPPFLGQLTLDTARDSHRRDRLAAMYEGLAGGYVDESGLFLHLALSRMGPSGVVSLVLPESMMATRDAGPIREHADRVASLAVLWIDEGQSFDAAVDVVAPVLTAQQPRGDGTTVLTGTSTGREVDRPADGLWAPLLAAARGVPIVRAPDETGVVSDLASVTAGFRQHFYGLEGAVQEADAGNVGAHTAVRLPQLVTAGAIDTLFLRWGSRAVKFAGTRWLAPVVDLEEIADPLVCAWFGERLVPKLLLASQTKVLEAVADPLGSLLPSVPVLSVEPRDAGDLWKLAAVLASPWVSAWMASRSAGSGLSSNAFRVRASEVARIPLPADRNAWDRGALLAEQAQGASSRNDMTAYASTMRTLGDTMMEAYGGFDRSVIDWWWDRLGVPQLSKDAAY